MDTPICDFVQEYAEKAPLRLHMPGHKGIPGLGPEPWDLTEVEGADELYHARGIIKQSEENASFLWGTAATFYSTEGSSLCIRAMIYLALVHAKTMGRKPLIAAARNVHKTFLTACALLDAEVAYFIPPEENLLSCLVDPEDLEDWFDTEDPPTAVFVTSPDYLGKMQDIATLAEICHRHGALLLVDNAHGAYLHFLPVPRHPMDLGADLCCDSAHKTLPVLTGGAYLHISKTAPRELGAQAQRALSLFASTSPSYLILQSLDRVNLYLNGRFREELAEFSVLAEGVRKRLTARGWNHVGEEPLKLTLAPKPYGYTGLEIAERMRTEGMEPEFADPDFVVMMLAPAWGKETLDRIESFLSALPAKRRTLEDPPPVPASVVALTPRQALLAPQEELPLEECLGRILAVPTVSCPPAVPILVCGERITAEAMDAFRYYGHKTCVVVKK